MNLLAVFVSLVCALKQGVCSQSLLRDDACTCVHVCIDACMFACMCMNKAYANTATPGRLCMCVCECMNKANALPGCAFMSVCVCA